MGVPDLTDGDWQDTTADKQIITNGKKRMPKQGHKLNPEEIRAVVKYIRFFTPKKRR